MEKEPSREAMEAAKYLFRTEGHNPKKAEERIVFERLYRKPLFRDVFMVVKRRVSDLILRELITSFAHEFDAFAAPLHQKIDDLAKERDALQAKLDAINSEARQEFERERKQVQADIDKVRKSLQY